MSSGSSGKGSSSSSSRVRIPRFLRPLIEQGVDTGIGSLQSLEAQLGGATGDDLVAPFNEQQLIAQLLGTNRALGEGEFFSTARDTVRDAAAGEGLDAFVPSSALDSLNQTASSGGLDFLPPEIRQALTQSSRIEGIAPSALPSSVLDTLGASANTPQVALDALNSTANGDFLFGGQGFDEAVQAAVRAATPGIISTFGRAGSGGATGGLAQAAIGTAATDAFARQFANERGNQLGAANTLADLELANRGQDINSAGLLGDLGLSVDRQNADIASRADSFDLSRNDVLTSLFESGQNRSLDASQILAGLGLNERSNQLTSASLLPDIASADLDLLSGIGAQRQDQAQDRLTAPINAQLQLLAAALGGVPIESLLGRKSSGSTSQLSLGFG